MSDNILNIAIVSGSPRSTSNTRIMMKFIYDHIKKKSQNTKFLDLSKVNIETYRGNDRSYNEDTRLAIEIMIKSDIWFIGSPIYNSFFSSALKNLFEFIDYKNTNGKVAGLAIMAAGKIGFINVHTLLVQLMTYFKVITNPKAVYMSSEMIKEDQIIVNEYKNRLKDLADTTLTLAKKIK